VDTSTVRHEPSQNCKDKRREIKISRQVSENVMIGQLFSSKKTISPKKLRAFKIFCFAKFLDENLKPTLQLTS
jgi:hypothetical protein